MDRGGHREYDSLACRWPGAGGLPRRDGVFMRPGEIRFTEGSILGKMLRFSLPFLAANFLQALYGVADMMVVGRVSGPTGVSAIQVGGQVVSLITNVAMGLSVAATVLVAQYLGAGKKEEQNKVIGTMMTLFLLLSALVTALLLFGRQGILGLLHTPQEAWMDASRYLMVSAVGMLFVFGYNLIGAVLRAVGDATRPLLFAAVGTGLNVGLDLLFVWAWGMGAWGAALATVVSQGVSFVLAAIYCVRHGFFDFRPRSFGFDRHILGLVLKVGVPSGVQFSVTGLAFLALTGLANRIAGVVGSTVLGIGTRVNSFGVLPCMALSSAVTAMAGQNLGAGKTERARRVFWLGSAVAFGISLVVFTAVSLWPEEVIRLFLNMGGRVDDKNLVEQCLALGTPYLRRISFDYLFASVFFCANGLANAAGQTWFTLLNSAVNALVVRLPLAYVLTGVWFGRFDWGMNGIGTAVGFAPVVSMILGLLYALSGHWKKARLTGDTKKE